MKKRFDEQTIGALPALPVAVWNVMRLTNTPDAQIGHIEQAIAGDPALTSALLKLANSAYYGLPRQVSRLSEAVVFLGTKVVRNMALTIGTMGIWSERDHRVAAIRQAMWCYALQKAVAAKALARQVGGVDQENAFLAGLLHDIGNMVLLHHLSRLYIAYKPMMNQPMPDLPRERDVFGMNHLEMGRLAGEKWQLPEAIIEAIEFHHDPGAAPQQSRLAAIVFLSDCLTWALENWTELAQAETNLTSAFPTLPQVLSSLNLTMSDVPSLIECVQRTHDDVMAILSIAYPDAPVPRGFEPSLKKRRKASVAPPRPAPQPKVFRDEEIRALEERILREQHTTSNPLLRLLQWLGSLLTGRSQ